MKTTPTVAVSLLVVVLSAAQLSSALFINPLDIFRLSSARSVDESLEVCGNPVCPNGFRLNSDGDRCQCEATEFLGVSIPGCRNSCVLDQNGNNCRCLITGKCYAGPSCTGPYTLGLSVEECCRDYGSYEDGPCKTCVRR